jgi:uncharacterized protein YjiS (DUF1127 family)
MRGQSHLAVPDNLLEYRTSEHAPATLPAAIALRLTKLRSAWKRQASSRRLARSIAHLDDRLLADIGLGPEDLGFAERFARRRATDGIWAGSKAGPGTDWQ